MADTIFKVDKCKLIDENINKMINNLIPSNEMQCPDKNSSDYLFSIYQNTKDSIVFIDDESELLMKKISSIITTSCCKCVSESFIIKAIEEWVHDLAGREELFSTWIEKKIQSSISDYYYAFPIYKANYSKKGLNYKVTNDVFFVNVASKFLQENLYNDKTYSIDESSVFVCTIVRGEKEYAESKAFEKCSFAVDIFKICSDLTYNPYHRDWEFDIENRNLKKTLNISVVRDIKMNDDNCYIHFSIKQFPVSLTDETLASVNKRHFPDFVKLYEEYFNSKQVSKNTLVLKYALHRYSAALSEIDPYEKVVSLCSVLDILILDKDMSIVAALKRYIPVLIEKRPQKRNELKALLEKMYRVRSNYIHHFSKSESLSNTELSYFKNVVFILIHKLLLVRNNYKNFNDIYKLIDSQIQDAIDNVCFDEE